MLAKQSNLNIYYAARFHKFLDELPSLKVKEAMSAEFAIAERTEQSLEKICQFYKSVGYNGTNEVDHIFLAYLEQTLIGAFRISFENDFPILRGMFPAKSVTTSFS